MSQPDRRVLRSSVESPYRAGPWPGLTARGAWVLIGYAGLLALGVLAAGAPRRPLPDVPLLAFLSCVPLLMATRVTRVPGAASAVCGAYLLPRTLLSLGGHIEPPPLLLAPAFALDALIWLRAADLQAVRAALPRVRRHGWPRRVARVSRELRPGRAAIGGALYGLLLSAVVPPWTMILGTAEPATWSGPDVWLGGLASSAVCALEGWLIVRTARPGRLSGRTD